MFLEDLEGGGVMTQRETTEISMYRCVDVLLLFVERVCCGRANVSIPWVVVL